MAPEDIARLWTSAQSGTSWSGRSVACASPSAEALGALYRRLKFETDIWADYSTLSSISRGVVDACVSLRDQDREYMIALRKPAPSTPSATP